MDVQLAAATTKEDAAVILRRVDKYIGFDKCNAKVWCVGLAN
jgi:hypothetical protein